MNEEARDSGTSRSRYLANRPGKKSNVRQSEELLLCTKADQSLTSEERLARQVRSSPHVPTSFGTSLFDNFRLLVIS